MLYSRNSAALTACMDSSSCFSLSSFPSSFLPCQAPIQDPMNEDHQVLGACCCIGMNAPARMLQQD